MSSVPSGTSAFASSLANAASVSTLLSWLENEMCAERQAVEHALKDRHQALLKRLEAVVKDNTLEWPSSNTSFTFADATGSLGTKSVWVKGTPLNLPIGQRHHCPPAEPSSPSSSFLLEDHVPQNGAHPGGEHEQMFDEHIVQTPVLNDVLEKHSDTHTHQKSTSFTSNHEIGDLSNSGSQSISENGFDVNMAPTRKKKWKRKGQTRQMTKFSLEAQQNWRRWLMKVVLSGEFEAAFAVLILLNTFTMAIEAQYRGIENGFQVEYHAYTRPAVDVWPGLDRALVILEWFFGFAFTVQLVLRFMCLHINFFREFWNLVDTLIVGAWLFSTASSAHFSVDPLLLRLARLVRLLRLLRLVKTIKLFDALYLMTTAMQSSLSTLMWAILLLFLVLTMLGLLLQKLVEPYVLDSNNPTEKRLHVFMFYGTFVRSMLTMFEMTLGNWIPPCRALFENVNEWFVLVFLAHKLVVGFSVVSVINAVFVQETFKVATSDDRILLMVKERAKKTHLAKIQDLLHHVDEDGSGTVTLDELCLALSDPEVRTYLAALDLDIRDGTHLFDMLDLNEDGSISLEELSDGMFRLRGAAKSYDVQYLLNHVRQLNDQLVSMSQQVPPNSACTKAS